MSTHDGIAQRGREQGVQFPLAYIRPVLTEKGKAFAIFAADGRPLATFESSDAARCAAMQHELNPASVH